MPDYCRDKDWQAMAALFRLHINDYRACRIVLILLASALNVDLSLLYWKTTDQILEALRGSISKITVDKLNVETSVRTKDPEIALLGEEVTRLSSADVDSSTID